MKKREDEERDGADEEMTPDEVAKADDYLSRLAQSVLKREPFPYKSRVAGSDRKPVHPGSGTPRPSKEIIRPSQELPRSSRDVARPNQESPRPGQDIPRPPSAQTPSWQARTGATPAPVNTPRPLARHTPAPVTRRSPVPAPRETPQPHHRDSREVALGADGTFPVGTILYFEDKSIGIYKDRRTDREYEVIYLLLPDGRVLAQGIALSNYEVKVIGTLPTEFMLRIQRRQRWDRDEVVYHLESFDYCRLIPHPTTQDIEVSTPRPARREEEPKTLVAGRRFSINFGNQEWHAVFWGEDELGPVVAHNTHDRWAVMHLDLNRFRDSLVLGEMIDEALKQEIRGDLAAGPTR